MVFCGNLQHSYLRCVGLLVWQAKVDATYKDKAKWTKMSIMSTAGSAKFSSDRTIQEYADDIWQVKHQQDATRDISYPLHGAFWLNSL